MRTLMMAAATAAALMAGSAYADGSGMTGSQAPSSGSSVDRNYDNSLQPIYRDGTTESQRGWTGDGTSGSSVDDNWQGSGSSGSSTMDDINRSPGLDTSPGGIACPTDRPNCVHDGD